MSAAEQLGGPLAEHLAKRIPTLALSRHRRFPDVDAADFEQEMWAHALAHAPRFRRLFEEGKLDLIRLDLASAATKYGYDDERDRRARKAKEAGYSTTDEEFYGSGLLRLLLPVLIEAEFDPANAIERATQGTDAAGVRIHSADSDHAAENYMVMLIDVCDAYRKLNTYQQRLLRDWYGMDQSDTDNGRWERSSKASSMGLTVNALQLRVKRAVEALQRELGGKSPWIRDEPEESEFEAA